MTSERRGQLELTIVVAEVMAARPAKTRTVSFMAVIILRFLVAKGNWNNDPYILDSQVSTSLHIRALNMPCTPKLPPYTRPE
jgi:hypothetical protein